MRLLHLALCVFPAICAPCGAQLDPVWTKRLPTASPGVRTDHAVAYDVGRQRLVLFGGQRFGVGHLDDTWEWDGAGWTERLPANRPSARSFHTMVYEPTRGRVLLFGGEDASGLLGDVWQWDGVDWVRLRCAAPTPRKRHAMACSSAGEILVFGGEDGSGPLGDTWLNNGGCFTQLAPVHAPSPRLGAQVAWDAGRAEFVLFGGLALASLGDTWVWSGTDWVQRVPAQHPPPRYEHAMIADATTGRVVLYGGLGWWITWEWDGASWAETSPANRPTAVVGIGRGLAHDPTRGRVVLVGGVATGSHAETWEYYRGVSATAVPYGAGCVGSNSGILTLAPEDAPPPQLAWIGSAVVQRISRAPMFTNGAVLTGINATGPIDLGPVGAPGCALHVDAFTALGVPVRFGVATLTTTIPDDPSLPGRVFRTQAAVLDVGANALGVTTSNGVTWTIGG